MNPRLKERFRGLLPIKAGEPAGNLPEDFEAVTGFLSAPLKSESFRDLLFTSLRQSGYESPQIDDLNRAVTASREIPIPAPLTGSKSIALTLYWEEITGEEPLTEVAWIVFDQSPGSRRRPDKRAAKELLRVLEAAVREAVRRLQLESELESNTIIAPGQKFPSEPLFNSLRDYSGFATKEDVKRFHEGTLSLGRWAFGKTRDEVEYGPALFMAKDPTGKLREYRGTLVCAPQNSGKTELLLRWAAEANRAGYSLFIVDVKGTFYEKLLARAGALEGNVYHFTTDPDIAPPDCHKLNFLEGLRVEKAAHRRAIDQLVHAILPDRGNEQGDDQFYYELRVKWLRGFIHVLKLYERYFLKSLSKVADLAMLYELVTREETFLTYLSKIKEWEGELKIKPGVGEWISELALLIPPGHEKIRGGQRESRYTFQALTAGIATALRPFSQNGTLLEKISGVGDFSFEQLNEETQTTVILAAREQDLGDAVTVVSMAVKRLENILFNRMKKANNRLLLLLDETRRVRSFNAGEYVTFAREAQAGCVIVYQSLDQIGKAPDITELLENVGTQIYLGTVVGNSARSFIDILPKRYRSLVSEQTTMSAQGIRGRSLSASRELVDFVTTGELYDLPAGRYPALVYFNDLPRCKPVLVDMFDDKLKTGTTTVNIELDDDPEVDEHFIPMARADHFESPTDSNESNP